MDYFNKLPTITYEKYLAKNLLARADLSESTKRNKEVYYPYTMDAVDRADIISNDYYDSPNYTWLVYFANEVIDPYYDFPLSQEDFQAFIVNKYGSWDTASRKILFYRNNWYDNIEERLTNQQYDSLNPTVKKYYEPIVDSTVTITGYKRRQVDHTLETNRTLTLNINAIQGSFTVGEEVQVNPSNYGFVTYASSTVISVDKVTGSFTNGDSLIGVISRAVANVTTSTTIATAIANIDQPFWSPVTALEYETEFNEFKRHIKLIDSRYAGQVESDLRALMERR